MTCPLCFGDTKIYYTIPDEDIVYRKRKCKKCGHIMLTVECEPETDEEKHMTLLDFRYADRIRRQSYREDT